MSTRYQVNYFKESILNWTISIFIILIIVAAIFTDLFQTPETNLNTLKTYIQLYPTEKLKNLTQIKISNNQGDFTLIKNATNMWSISTPRNLTAKQPMVTTFINAISQLSVRNLYQKDTINLTNFALNNPRYKINLKFSSEHKIKDETLYFGMKNPISNTNYILLNTKEIIYQTSQLAFPAETLRFTDFIDSRIFKFNSTQVKSIKIIRYKKTFLNIKENSQKRWSQNGKELNAPKVIKYIDSLLTIKSHIILDKINEKQQKRLDRYFKSPPIEIVISFKDGSSKKLYTTTLLKHFPSIDLKGELFFFIHAEGSTSYQLMLKRDYSLFLKNYR